MYVVYRAINILFYIIEVFIIIRALLSFLPISPYNPISRIVYEMTEPVLGPCRKLLEKLGLGRGMFDFSPLLAMFFLRIIQSILIKIIF